MCLIAIVLLTLLLVSREHDHGFTGGYLVTRVLLGCVSTRHERTLSACSLKQGSLENGTYFYILNLGTHQPLC